MIKIIYFETVYNCKRTAPYTDDDFRRLSCKAGTGILTTGAKAGLAAETAYKAMTASTASLKPFSGRIPLLGGARELAEMGIIPAGAYRNMDYVKPHLKIMESAGQPLVDLISDQQTSGGLFVSLPGSHAMELCRKLKERSLTGAIIGEVIEKQETDLIVE